MAPKQPEIPTIDELINRIKRMTDEYYNATRAIDATKRARADLTIIQLEKAVIKLREINFPHER
jgi:hypothetical protein